MNSTNYTNQVYKGIKEVIHNAMSSSIEALKENRVIDFYNTTEWDEVKLGFAEESDYIEQRKPRSKPKGKDKDDIITY